MTMNERTSNILDRTLRRFRQAWSTGGKGPLQEGVDPDLLDKDIVRLRRQVDACLEARGGHASARARAADLGETYLILNETGRRRFLEVLAREYDVDPDAVDNAIDTRQAAPDEAARHKAELALREALVPPRIKLLSQFNELSQGVKFLVDLRAELMAFARDDANLRQLDADVHRLLTSWFDVGFLELKRITWDTPAALLEKLIEYEAVHAIRSWDDLKNRLEADRRCYAYFHPHMPDEPLIFVQVALATGMSGNIQKLLDEHAPEGDPKLADTAVFYSISNCQSGLAGVNFGDFLIKRVVDDLAKDLPRIKSFVTLSPLPGFRSWIRTSTEDDEQALFNDEKSKLLIEATQEATPLEALEHILEQPDWHHDDELCSLLEPLLVGLCAGYLVNSRNHNRAHDRVAHFHLSNGARIERINWLADTSPNGLEQSAGLMVNYRYELDAIEKNHESYTGQGAVSVGPAVKKLL